ncbi:MAG: rod shape-determining protein MreD [Alphaproteobacteria bacterium]
MTGTIWQRMDLWVRLSTPFALGLVVAVVSVLPWPLPGGSTVTPPLPLAIVYYWALQRDDVMTPPAVFMLGLTQDMLGGAPLGLNALVLLLVAALVRYRGRPVARQPFVVLWWGYAVVAALAEAALWGVGSVYQFALLAPQPFLVQYLLGVCLYPLLSLLCAGLQRTVVGKA